jgi:hypothetical protein
VSVTQDIRRPLTLIVSPKQVKASMPPQSSQLYFTKTLRDEKTHRTMTMKQNRK